MKAASKLKNDNNHLTWLFRDTRRTFLMLLVTHIVFIILFFDSKLHTGGDDSDYIIAGVDFIRGDQFPSWHGVFYPMLIGSVVAVLGVNLILLKLVSVLLSIGTFWLTYRAFKGKVPDQVLFFALFIVACSYMYVVYASTTYSEPLFLTIQATLFVIIFRLIDTVDNAKRGFYLDVLLLSVTLFFLSITRNVGFGALVAISLFFLFEKRYRLVAIATSCFLSLHGLLKLYKLKVWNVQQMGISGQLSRMAYKDFYDPTKGTDNAMGFVIRFWENSNVYLSGYLAKALGLRSLQSETLSAWLTVLFFLLFFVAIILTFKRNKFLLFVTIYVGVMLTVTFITQQTHWQQERLIIVYLPLMAILIGFVFHMITLMRTRSFQLFGKAALVIVPFLVIIGSIRTEKNIWNTIAELNGRAYAGYSDDWASYAEVSKWTGVNIPETNVVLCRKPGMARIFGNRKFVGISRFHETRPDSADAFLRKRNVTYVILDNLPLATVSRLLFYYLQKYPLGLELVFSKGNDKPSYLLKITRQIPKGDDEFFKRIEAGKLLYPFTPYYYVISGDKHLEGKKFQNAVSEYSKALDLDPPAAEKNKILLRRGLANFYLGNIDKSQHDVERILSTVPDEENAWLMLGNIYERRGMLIEAQAAFSRANRK